MGFAGAVDKAPVGIPRHGVSARLLLAEGDRSHHRRHSVDWGTDSARASRHVHEVKEGAVLGMDYILDNLALTESQIRKAGYRLAKLLNEIFG